MEFPQTKFIFMGFFAVIISAMDLPLPKLTAVEEEFYDLYAIKKPDMPEAVIELKNSGPHQLIHYLCSCLMEQKKIIVPQKPTANQVVTGRITSPEEYCFKFEKPRKTIVTSILSCYVGLQNAKFFAAFSDNSEKYFYAERDVFSSFKIKGIIEIPGFEDFDQNKLTKLPYWCQQLAAKTQEMMEIKPLEVMTIKLDYFSTDAPSTSNATDTFSKDNDKKEK